MTPNPGFDVNSFTVEHKRREKGCTVLTFEILSLKLVLSYHLPNTGKLPPARAGIDSNDYIVFIDHMECLYYRLNGDKWYLLVNQYWLENFFLYRLVYRVDCRWYMAIVIVMTTSMANGRWILIWWYFYFLLDVLY